MTRPPDHSPPRRPAAIVAISWLAFVLANGAASSAGAQPRPDDLPPEPGTLERELSLGPVSKPPAPGTGPNLSNPIEIPFILEGGHIIVEAAIDGGPPKPFLFDTGASILITLRPRDRSTRQSRERRALAASGQESRRSR